MQFSKYCYVTKKCKLGATMLTRHQSVTDLGLNGVTFDQNGQNAISADFEFLAASLPSW